MGWNLYLLALASYVPSDGNSMVIATERRQRVQCHAPGQNPGHMSCDDCRIPPR